MSGRAVICENCGAVCNTEDGYCKACWKKLTADNAEEDHILEGIGESEWKSFIEKNTDYYMPIFKKHEGKKVFVSMNWSAFLLGCSWLFYRRMYKAAIMVNLLYVLLAVLMLLFTLTYANDIHSLRETVSAYNDYVDGGGEDVLYTSTGKPYTPEIVEEAEQAQRELNGIVGAVVWKSTLSSFVLLPLLMGLFGNAVYKNYIHKHIHDPNGGGASIASYIAGAVGMNVLESVVSYLLAGLMMLGA